MKYIECLGCPENLYFEGENFERLECPNCGVLNWSFDHDPSKYKDYDGSQVVYTKGTKSTQHIPYGLSAFFKVLTFLGGSIVLYYQWSWISLSDRMKRLISYGDIMSTYSPLFLLAVVATIVGIVGWVSSGSNSVNNTNTLSKDSKPVEKEAEQPKASDPSKIDDSISSRLRELSSLKDDGILTEEEFEAKKKELLDRM